jgi:hypothetical protein
LSFLSALPCPGALPVSFYPAAHLFLSLLLFLFLPSHSSAQAGKQPAAAGGQAVPRGRAAHGRSGSWSQGRAAGGRGPSGRRAGGGPRRRALARWAAGGARRLGRALVAAARGQPAAGAGPSGRARKWACGRRGCKRRSARARGPEWRPQRARRRGQARAGASRRRSGDGSAGARRRRAERQWCGRAARPRALARLRLVDAQGHTRAGGAHERKLEQAAGRRWRAARVQAQARVEQVLSWNRQGASGSWAAQPQAAWSEASGGRADAREQALWHTWIRWGAQRAQY